ncbi:MAG: hypothetical protein LC772_02795, partial [Chloroflexi bacterium]|nr:hypothetical protein [Chloroflexota bacterium]
MMKLIHGRSKASSGCVLISLLAGYLALSSLPVLASGHGPLYGLATPTNGKGSWSIDDGIMAVSGSSQTGVMSRLMAAYGVTQDLQLSLSGRLFKSGSSRSSKALRGLGMMPMNAETEVMAADRFIHRNTGIGSRDEDTAYLALDLPNDDVTRPGILAAAAHGSVSRTWYLWEGAGYQAYASGGSHPGNELFYSLAAGYRPKAWQLEYPKPDFRLLLELLGEAQQQGTWHGVRDLASGGHRVFLTPGVLSTY